MRCSLVCGTRVVFVVSVAILSVAILRETNSSMVINNPSEGARGDFSSKLSSAAQFVQQPLHQSSPESEPSLKEHSALNDAIRRPISARAAKPSKTRIACVGDSITFGFGANATMDYPTQLQKMIGPGYTVMNFGHSGKCMQKHPRFSYWHSQLLKMSSSSMADVVVLMLGTNDGLHKADAWNDDGRTGREPFKRDYMEMINMFRAMKSHPAIYIMTPPPVYLSVRFAYRRSHSLKKAAPTEDEVLIVNNVIPQLVREVHRNAKLPHPLIDISEIMGGRQLGHPEWSLDGTHPNDAGYMQIASAVKKALNL